MWEGSHAEARKTTMGHITADHIQQSRIVIPLPDVLGKHGEYVSAIYQEFIVPNKENPTLVQLRDGLLPLLMNGPTEVSE